MTIPAKMTLSLKPGRRLPLVLHILAWVIILVLPRYLVNTWGDGDMRFLHHYYLNTAFYGVFFYLNYLVLVPGQYFSEKRFRYFISLVLAIAVISILLWYLNDALFNNRERIREAGQAINHAGQIQEGGHMQGPGRDGGEGRPPPFRIIGLISHVTTLILLTGFSLGLAVLDKMRSNEKEKKEMEKEMLNTELALLKNQVSPHFFFNTLNNIYSLIQYDTEKAGETVHKLSKLMRYLLYETDQDLSGLPEEVQFMRNYIELMQLRLNEKVRLQVDLPDDPPALMIPPLLFIPVIENAFKHGISYREDSFIEISMEVVEPLVLFRTRNSINHNENLEPEKHMGIGLENVRKRLSLLFPGRHNLEVKPGPEDFRVEISVDIRALLS